MPATALIVHPSAELYGSDRVAVESARALHEAGWTVVVALADDGPLRDLMQQAGARVVVVAAPVLRKAYLSPRGLLRLAGITVGSSGAMWRTLRTIDPDVVYASTLTMPWWVLLARARRVPVVVHVHEAEDSVPWPARVALAAPLLLAARVLVNSRAAGAALTGVLPRLARRIDVLVNGVPGPPTVAPPRAQLAGEVRLALVGRVSPRKGTDVAVRALGLLRAAGTPARLELVGGVFDGYRWFEEEVRELAREVGVQEAVTWSGVLPQVWAALARCDVALVPSRVEPFGNAAVEAMLAQRPVVAGDTQGLREIVRPGENGDLVAPGDPAALAAAVQRLVADWPATRQRAAVARVEAETRYSPARYRQQLVALVARHAAPEQTPHSV